MVFFIKLEEIDFKSNLLHIFCQAKLLIFF